MRASVVYLPPSGNGKESQVHDLTNGGGFEDERIMYKVISCFRDVDRETSSLKPEDVLIIQEEEPTYNTTGLTKDECPPDSFPKWRQGRRSKRSSKRSCRNMAEEPRQQKKQQKLHVHCKSFSIRNTEEVSASGNHRPAIRRRRDEKRKRDDDQLLPVKSSRKKPTEDLPIPHHRAAAVASSPLHADRHERRVKRADLQSSHWPKINLTLSLKEKEEDFSIMKGAKLPRRPKKRPKNVERALQFSTPGNWLPEINKARYEVKEKKTTKKKRPSGLKGMQSMATESD